ncbi:unnamed protein product [Chrysoparadoxa australica]
MLLPMVCSKEATPQQAVAYMAFGKASERLLGGSQSSKGRSMVTSQLPRVVPALLLALNAAKPGEEAESDIGGRNALAALEQIYILLSLLRSSMRPHLLKVEAAVTPLLASASAATRCLSAKVLAMLPLCSDPASAWVGAMKRISLEAHALLEGVWPDKRVVVPGAGRAGKAKLQSKLASDHSEEEGSTLPQQARMLQVQYMLHGLVQVIVEMMQGDTGGVPVAVPLDLLLSLAERVLLMDPSARRDPSAKTAMSFLPQVQEGLSPVALSVILPSLRSCALSTLRSCLLAGLPPLRHLASRYCRALLRAVRIFPHQGGLQRDALEVSSQALQVFGAAGTRLLAAPLIPLLAELCGRGFAGDGSSRQGRGSSEFKLAGSLTEAGSAVTVAQSAKKSSKKRQRQEREKAFAASERERGERNRCASVGAVDAGVLEASLRTLNSILMTCGRALPIKDRDIIEAVAMAGLAQGLSAADGSATTMLVTLLPLLKHCLEVPRKDSTRSGLLGRGASLFAEVASDLSRPPEVTLYAKEGLLACEVLLHPRAAPLFTPHTVTHELLSREGSLAIGQDSSGEALTKAQLEKDNESEGAQEEADGSGDDMVMGEDVGAVEKAGGAAIISATAEEAGQATKAGEAPESSSQAKRLKSEDSEPAAATAAPLSDSAPAVAAAVPAQPPAATPASAGIIAAAAAVSEQVREGSGKDDEEEEDFPAIF